MDKVSEGYKLTISQRLILVYHCFEAANDPEIGFEDAWRTVEELVEALDNFNFVYRNLLESALWCCNLLDEKGKFWHPMGLSFEEYLHTILKKDEDFDYFYNLIVKKEGRQ